MLRLASSRSSAHSPVGLVRDLSALRAFALLRRADWCCGSSRDALPPRAACAKLGHKQEKTAEDAMLRAEDNKFLTESGAGTPMGELLRRFWLPVLLSEELPEADGPPKKIAVMG